MSRQSILLIAFTLCLLKASLSFSQQKSPVLIPYEGDTLVAITEHQFDVVLFSFSYLRELKEDKTLVEAQLAKTDSVIKFMDKQFVLQAKADREKDEVIENLEVIIKHHKKELRKQKLKSTLLNIGLAVVVAAETVIIVSSAIR